MEDGEDVFVVPISLGQQIGVLFYIALLFALALGLIRLSFSGGNQDWPIYSIPWCIFVIAISIAATFLIFWFGVLATSLVRFGKTNPVLTIDDRGITIPFTDPNSFISWRDIKYYERKKYLTRGNGFMFGLYVILKSPYFSWKNPANFYKIKVFECRVDGDENMDVIESIIYRNLI